MKRIVAILLIVPLFSLLTSCALLQNITDEEIIFGVTVATVTALRPIQPDSKRTQVANLVDYIASAARAVTGNPSSEELAALLTNTIPANLRTQYPELVAYIIPIIVSNYGRLHDKYGANQVVKILNDIATGLEAGASQYISHS